MLNISKRPHSQPVPSSYDEEFFDTMLEAFIGIGRGEAGKYIYNGDNWDEIINNSKSFYLPKADHDLLTSAIEDFSLWNIPTKTTYIDFGVGGVSSFKKYASPVMSILKSSRYIGVDFCEKVLSKITAIKPTLDFEIEITTKHMDFFAESQQALSPVPALGVMNGLTLTNMPGSILEKNVETNLILSLKHLSRLVAHGWLLISIDTNQNEAALLNGYLTPLNSKLNIASLPRMKSELPVVGFDDSLFSYTPEWIPEKQLFAHIATATEKQDFWLGPYYIHIQKGQKIHLFNSYKFRQDFFESCCTKANLDIVKSWKHDSGVMLYLLEDLYKGSMGTLG